MAFASSFSYGAGCSLARFEKLLVEIGHAFFLSADIEGAIPADSEEPFRRGAVEFGPILLLQFHKRFLHDITRAVANRRGFEPHWQERLLEALEERLHLTRRQFLPPRFGRFAFPLTNSNARDSQNYKIFLQPGAQSPRQRTAEQTRAD